MSSTARSRAVTFGGRRSVTIPVGQEVWSDAIKLSWVEKTATIPTLQGRNLAVSYSIAGDSGHMTFHSGANQTSFITAAGSGDHTADVDVFAYEFTTTSWFFLTRSTSWRPADTVVVCAFGDSITDGTHTTFNINDRWSNVLSRRLHNAYGNKVSVVNEAIGGNRVVNPAVVRQRDLGPSRDRPARPRRARAVRTDPCDLARRHQRSGAAGSASATRETRHHTRNISGLPECRRHAPCARHQGIGRHHDLGLGHAQSRQGWAGTPGYTGGGDNGPVVDANRMILNTYIRTSGLYRRRGRFRRGDARSLDRQHEGGISAQQPVHRAALGLSPSQSCRLQRDGHGGGHQPLCTATPRSLRIAEGKRSIAARDAPSRRCERIWEAVPPFRDTRVAYWKVAWLLPADADGPNRAWQLGCARGS